MDIELPVEEWKKDPLQHIIGKISEYVLIANWFTKDVLEEVTGMALTEKQYLDIVELYNDSEYPDKVSELIKQFFGSIKWESKEV